MKTEGYTFTNSAGMKAPAGKPHWPHFLRLRIKRKDALSLIRELVANLENNDRPEIELALFGEIFRDTEDDFDWPNNPDQPHPVAPADSASSGDPRSSLPGKLHTRFMEIPANITDYISRLSIATRIATNAYGNPYGPKQAPRRAPSPELLKFLGDAADALHNIDKGPEHFYAFAGELNAAWADHKDKLVHERHDLASLLLPLPSSPLQKQINP